jgi:hypothetical protein
VKDIECQEGDQQEALGGCKTDCVKYVLLI